MQAAHAPLVAAVVRERLALQGQALLCCAVRDQVRLCADQQAATSIMNAPEAVIAEAFRMLSFLLK